MVTDRKHGCACMYVLEADHLICGGGGLCFFFVIKLFFSTASLNIQFLQTLSKANNFFSHRSNIKQLFKRTAEVAKITSIFYLRSEP